MAICALFRRLFAGKFAGRALLASFIVVLLLSGVQLRRWTGEKTRHVRFQHDIVNGFYWGSETLAEARRLSSDEASANSWTAFCRGYFALYDRVKREAYENDFRSGYFPPSPVVGAPVVQCDAVTLPARFVTAAARFDLRFGSGERCLA